MHIEYTRHAELKLKERKISKSEVNAIINDPDEILLDIETGNLVAVGNMESRPDHKLIVVYSDGETRKPPSGAKLIVAMAKHWVAPIW